MKMSLYGAIAALCIVATAMPTLAAPVQAVNFSSPTTDFTNGQWSLGYSFTVGSQPVYATHLGFYDAGQNGLSQSHSVGLYTSGGTLLASTTISNANALNGFFRYGDIADVLLQARQTYVVAATTGSENYTWNPTGFTVDPRITFNGDRFVASSTLAFPTSSSGLNGWFGANLMIDNVPEPATLAVFGVLAAGAFGIRRRMRA